MQRRKFIQQTLGAGAAITPVAKLLAGSSLFNLPFSLNGPARPVMIYNNWSSYDELSDNIPLTETLAMRELDELVRLQQHGVHFDYYMMDAFWFDKDGGYRTWHKEHWPNGPDKWLDACKQHGVLPGMWFSTNLITMGGKRVLEPVAAWQSSVATDPNILCLFEGGYLQHLLDTLQFWYNKGVRAFKFDFAYFSAATKAAKEKYTPEEIEEKNKVAFMNMLKAFRKKNPNVLITGYNGFGGDMENTFTPFRKNIDHRWLDVFDTLYCGDPRFSDVPMMNIWRSADTYSDHMVRQFEYNGLPLRRIDNCACMIGKTGTCYYRGLQAWKGMLILEYARGGWVNVIHGNLELLTNDDAKWFAKVQRLYMDLQKTGTWSIFGSVPGHAAAYGFVAKSVSGTLYTVVNPSQEMAAIKLPGGAVAHGMILYTDGGFKPFINSDTVTLGPEQLVVVGYGKFASEKYLLGVDETIQIPSSIKQIDASFASSGNNTIEAQVNADGYKTIRILFQQFGADGNPYRTWGGAPPDGKNMDEYLKIIVRQGDKIAPTEINYNKMIWSGLSWAAAEVKMSDADVSQALTVTCMSIEKEKMMLKAKVYGIQHSPPTSPKIDGVNQ